MHIVSTSGIYMDIMNIKFGLVLIKHFQIGVIQSVILKPMYSFGKWWRKKNYNGFCL